jgi:nitroreductase
MLGFEKEIKTLLLIAADITCFGGAEEIHQMFVDGSLFAMSLIYALHERGLATCPLHAGFNKVSERALRRMVSLPEFHCPILFIAIGHYEDVFKVTCSGRKEVDEILIYCRQNGG